MRKKTIQMMKKRRKQKMKKRRRNIIFSIITVIIIGIFMNIRKNNSIEKLQIITKKIDNNNPIVYIDAGHGGFDPGTIGISNIYEKEITLNLSLKLGKILKENNINVIYTRTTDDVNWASDEEEDLEYRINQANSKNVDAFVSIHCNSFNDPIVKGVEVWTGKKNTKGEELAKIIKDKMIELNYTSDRGLKYESDGEIKIIKKNNAPAALIELGYISNESDKAFLTSDYGQTRLAQFIADGIIEYL